VKRTLVFLLLASALAHAAPRKAKRATPDLANQAARALFVESDLERARSFAAQASARDVRDLRALFVAMEAAALAADSPAAVEAALRLCETRRADVRVNIAGARILELAANTPEFRAAVPRLERLLRLESPQASYLRAALLAAALDGLPGLDLAALAADAGIVTRWRVYGPFGSRPNVDWEQRFEPEWRPLAASYSGRATEEFQFLDGNVALPGYLRERDGIFYAEARVETAHSDVIVRLETAGTAQIMMDGETVLAKDDRLRASPQIRHVRLRLAAGSHRVLVKFLASAQPWRLSLTSAPAAAPKPRALPALPAEQRYLRAADAYWRGDFAAARAALPGPASAAEHYLLGRLAAAQPEEAGAYFRAALSAAPAALAATYQLALSDFEAGRVEEAAAAAARVSAERPSYAPALELLAEAAERLGWDRKALEAYEKRIELRPSCDVLLKAARLFAKSARYDKARAMEEQARDCAPASLAHAGALSERGEHAAAAASARRVLERAPLDRDAHALLVRELRLAGDHAAADAAATDLARLAPNRREPESRDEDFYLPYRRDGLALIRTTGSRRFSGGPIVELLSDKAVRLHQDGSATEYVHKLTRVLNKEGIERYGEVALPPGAELLELRTITRDGRLLEPELHEHKATISMPGLAPEDVIEVEYLLHLPARDALAEHPASFRATFGSFRAPILYARFVAEIPSSRDVRITDAPNTRTRTAHRDAFLVRSWEANDLPQSLEESGMPRSLALPAVALSPAQRDWSEVRDHYRELALEAAHASPGMEAIAASFRGTPEERARQLVAYAQRAIPSSDVEAFASGTVPSAEASLAGGEGSRTAAALALATAAGLEARLVLARHPGTDHGISPATFTRPLVAFVSGEKKWLADVETDGLAFGALPPDAAPGDALEVPLRRPSAGQPLIALAAIPEREQNSAQADIHLDAGGNASVHLEIKLGSYRSAQMRSTLRGLSEGQRRQVFEQLAARIFSGATAVSGTTSAENETAQPLTLEIRCAVPQLVALDRLARDEVLDIGQFVPVLGLRRMYASSVTRRFPLLIDVPLLEQATFRIHLPEGVRVAQAAADARLSSEFGDYALEFRRTDTRTFEVRRGFRIPAQLIAPAAYARFARFAAQIDEAERRRLSLARSAPGGATVAAR